MSIKSQRFLFLILIIAIAGMVIFNSCGKREKLMAKLGNLTITVNEYKDLFMQRYRTEENAMKQSYKERLDYLNQQIEQKLKLADAYRVGLDKNEEVMQKAQEAQERAAVQQVLFQIEVVNKVVTPESVKDYYNKMGEEIHARHILVKCDPNDTTATEEAKAKADSLYNLIKDGADFAEIARQYSDDKSNAGNGGDLDYFKWGRMVDEFQEAAFALKNGEISPPVLSPFGWHIIELLDRRPVEREPFDKVKDQITEDLKRARWSIIRELADQYLEDLKTAKDLEYYDDALNEIYGRISKSDAPQNQSVFSDFNEDDRKIVVASWSGGEVTVADLDEKIGTAPASYFKSGEDFKQVIDGIVIPKLLAAQAKEKGVYNAPEALKAAQEAREIQMLIKIEDLRVDDKINVDDETLLKYYNDNIDKYMTEPQVTVREILIDDKDKALELLERVKKGENFTKLAKKYTQRTSAQKNDGLIGPFGPKRYGKMGREAHSLEIGQFCDQPVRMGNNYSIFKVEKKEIPRLKPFEECKRDVERDYSVETERQLKREWMAMLHKEIPVIIYEKNLRNFLPFTETEMQKENDSKKEKPEPIKEEDREAGEIDSGGSGN